MVLHIVIGVQNDLDDAFFICPLDKVLTHPGILLPGSAQERQPVIFLFAADPGPVGAIDHTFAATNTLLSIPDRAVVLHYL